MIIFLLCYCNDGRKQIEVVLSDISYGRLLVLSLSLYRIDTP